MNKKDKMSLALQRSDKRVECLCRGNCDMTKLCENTAWAKMNREMLPVMNLPMDNISQMNRIVQDLRSAFALPTNHFSQMNHMVGELWSAFTIPMDHVLQMNRIVQEMCPAITFAGEHFSQLSHIAEEMRFVNDQISKLSKAYQIPNIVSHVNNTLPHLTSFDKGIFELAKEFDLSDVEFCDDGAITYEGETYQSEEIADVLVEQIDDAKKATAREWFEACKKKWWVLLLILDIITGLSQIPDTVEFCRDAIAEVQTILGEKPQLCATIKERSNLREGASMEANRIRYLPYDTSLEIIDTVPRWYQVRYVDENGDEVIGWIAKINVELEE